MDDDHVDWLNVLSFTVSAGLVLWQIWSFMPEHRKELIRLAARRQVRKAVLPFVRAKYSRDAQAMLTWEVFLVQEAMTELESHHDAERFSADLSLA